MALLKVLSIIFPVFFTIALGFIFARFKKIDLSPVIDILLYLAIPALVISSLSQKKFLVSELAIVAISVTVVVLSCGLLSYLYLRSTGRGGVKGFYLPAMFMNSGNMAFPLALLAFGSEGLSIAVLYYIAVGILVSTIGVAIANGRSGFKEILRLPLIYAAAFSLGLNFMDIELPGPLLETTTMLGAATIPLMQLSLGYRLYSTKLTNIGPSFAASVIRIGGGFIVAYVLVTMLGIEGLNKKIIILSSSMPAAVITFVISHKYKADSDLVASAIAMSTIISIITTPLLLLWLMNDL